MLADPSRSVYLILIVAVIVAAAVWVKKRTRGTLTVFGMTVALLLAITLIDRFVESPREEAVRRVQAMATAINDRNEARFLEQIHDNFKSNGRTKPELKSAQFWQTLQQYNVRVAVWDFNRDDVVYGDGSVEITFRAKGEEGGGRFLEKFVKAVFVRGSDEQWKLHNVKFYNFLNVLQEEPIPGFP